MLPSAYFFSSKLTFSIFSTNTFRTKVSNVLDPDQDRKNPDQELHSVGADLGPNCLQSLSAEDKVYRKLVQSDPGDILIFLKVV